MRGHAIMAHRELRHDERCVLDNPIHNKVILSNFDFQPGFQGNRQGADLSANILHALLAGPITAWIVCWRIIKPCQAWPQRGDNPLDCNHSWLAVRLQDYISPSQLLQILDQPLDDPCISRTLSVHSVCDHAS